jgi:hypothetical protein
VVPLDIDQRKPDVRRHLAALVAALTVLLTAGAGAAIADTPTQVADQAAGTSQSAGSTASSTQYAPSNSAVSVRIGSPGNNGSVSQSNSSEAAAAAGNLASTSQQAAQQQAGGGVQAAEQQAATQQSADADATSTQYHPSNSATSVRIGSAGDDGDVSQSNSSAAAALAGNAARTTQTADQAQGSGSCGCSGGGVQAAGQKAATQQSADADATSKQDHPSNSAISVRIHSPGDDGSVEQSNSSAALSKAGNAAQTTQSADQGQGSGSGAGIQALEQQAATRQDADSSATSAQYHPSNDATSVRIASPGDDGSVRQSNASFAGSFAGNAAATDQTADQAGSGGSGAGVQAIGQEAATWQDADSDATSVQYHPSNDVSSVRIGSAGGGGSVDQSNESGALSFAGNLAGTSQDATQHQSGGCGCGADRVQAVGQFAWTGQSAHSDATSEQIGASNSVTPVRIGSSPHGCGCESDQRSSCGCAPDGSSPGDDGDVRQANVSAAKSAALNKAATGQSVDQSQGSAPRSVCGCGSAGVQAAGQFASTGQRAGSAATSAQWRPSNSATPVRIASAGSGGSIDQANLSFAASLALNAAFTDQSVSQRQ